MRISPTARRLASTALVPCALSLLCALVVSLGDTARAQAWTNPVPEPALNAGRADSDPAFAANGTELWYASRVLTSGNFQDIYLAKRATPYGPFGAPVPVAELNTPATDAGPCLRQDGLEIFFHSTRGGGDKDLWRATRPTPSSTFSTPVPVTELNTMGSESDPTVSGDGLEIIFVRANNLWTARRASVNQPFTSPTPVTELNSSALDLDPHLSPDGLTVLFASTRTGGAGLADIWIARRVRPIGAFSPPTNPFTPNAASDDVAPTIRRTGDELFFASNRPGSPGGSAIYSSRFIGVSGAGQAGPGRTMTLTFSDPTSVGLPYAAAASFGTTPGVQIGGQLLRLNPDALFRLTAGGLPPVLNGFRGTIGANGTATGSIAIPPGAALRGLRIYVAFVVFNVTPAPDGTPNPVRMTSNALEILLQ